MDLKSFVGARIHPTQWIIADHRHAWHLQATEFTLEPDGFAKLSGGDNDLATIRNLLDGAIAAARSSVMSDQAPPPLSRLRWLWRLAGLYHLTHQTPTLMREAAERFRLAGHGMLARWADQKVTEEQGHDRLALADIQSLGYDPEWVVQLLQPPSAIALVDYFTRCVRQLDPLTCVGYAYTMERLAMAVDQTYIEMVEQHLPGDVCATRCLRVHSGIGSDQQHVDDTLGCVVRLPPEEYAQVAASCYQTALISVTPPVGRPISDDDLRRRLEARQ